MYLICVFAICVIIYVYYSWVRKYKDFNSLPGPPALPVLGNLFDLGTNTAEILANLSCLKKKYGEIFKLWVGPFNPTVVISGAEYLENILSSTEYIHKSETYEIFHSLMGQGLLTTKGEKWKKHRKLLTPSFHFKILETFMQNFNYLGNTLIEKLSENTHFDSFDVYPYINRYTLDVICETSMGLQLDLQNNPDHEYLQNMKEYKESVSMRQFSLIGRKENLYKFTPGYKYWQQCVDNLKAFTDDVIRQKHKQWETKKLNQNSEQHEKKKYKRPFLDLLFDMFEKSLITMEEIREEVDTFTFAGHDTIASALSFALFELAKHPDIQEKILEEINEHIGESKDSAYTITNLQNLKYLEYVCKEVMRLYTTVPLIERAVHKPLILNGKTIPKGTTILMFLYGLHNSDKYFEDAQEFKPERFAYENSMDRNTFAYVPFSAGPRNCIGQRFAMLEYKATLAKIIKNYVLLPAVPDHKPELGANLNLYSRNGMVIRIRSRCETSVL